MNQKMKNNLAKILVFSFLALSFTGCGNDTIGTLNSTSIPDLNNFTTTTLSTTAFGAGFTTATPYWLFNSGGYGSYLAPAAGYIGEIGTSTLIPGSSFVTILHSGRVMTRVHGIQTLNVRGGDYVAAQGTVGAFITSTQIAFQVFLDGVAVCPLSYMSVNFRASFAVGSYNPCR